MWLPCGLGTWEALPPDEVLEASTYRLVVDDALEVVQLILGSVSQLGRQGGGRLAFPAGKTCVPRRKLKITSHILLSIGLNHILIS